jgi:hypothetical protein
MPEKQSCLILIYVLNNSFFLATVELIFLFRKYLPGQNSAAILGELRIKI